MNFSVKSRVIGSRDIVGNRIANELPMVGAQLVTSDILQGIEILIVSVRVHTIESFSIKGLVSLAAGGHVLNF